MFEVASIRPSEPSSSNTSIGTNPGATFTANAITVRTLIRSAYEVHSFQISGGPKWISSARYDIVAKPDRQEDLRKLNREQMQMFRERQRLRLQSLLADRFQFKYHIVTKQLPIYALVVARNGPRLPAHKNEDDKSNGPMRMWPGQLIGQGLSMPLLASNLSNLVDRVVRDETRLLGLYDISLKWAPEQRQLAGLPSEIKATLPHPDLNGPSIFTAVQEQLGLKLQPGKGPVDILVIDHVEGPSQN